jgi:hypothetical protein
MQLTLSTTLPRPPRTAVVRPLVPLSREAAMSQLDQIAAANRSTSLRRDGLGTPAALLALLGGFVLVGAATMWRANDGFPAEQRTATGQQAARSAPIQTQTPLAATTVAVAEVPPALAPAIPVAQAMPEPAAPAEVAASSEAAAAMAMDEANRKARARQAAEAKRKAAQLAQERALAEEHQRLQIAAARREAEIAQQRASEEARQRAAAELARQQLLQQQQQALQLAMNTRRSVVDACSTGGLFAESACRVRECARAEFRGDPVCVRLRDSDEAQRRASLDR